MLKNFVLKIFHLKQCGRSPGQPDAVAQKDGFATPIAGRDEGETSLNRFAIHLLTGACALALTSAAAAQDAPADLPSSAPQDQPRKSDEGAVVVTALRREERLQNVPVSVTALSPTELATRRIATANDLVGSIPNLRSQTTVGSSTPIFALRGVSQSDYSVHQLGPFAIYCDEVYKDSFPLVLLATYDLERVEVLRGPHGTRYGKNTTGGATNFISRKPELDLVNGYLSLGGGNYDHDEASGAINIPLYNTVAMRTAFTFARANGWMDNVLPG